MTSKTLDPALSPSEPLTRRRSEFLRYFGASFIAMCADVGLLKAGLALDLHYEIAATLGFVAGLAIAYQLSVMWVFERRSLTNHSAEFVLFALVGMAGLGLTELMMWLMVERVGAGAMAAKAVALPCVFLFNFGVRKVLLFRGAR